MNVCHIADLHFHRDHFDEAKTSLEAIAQAHKIKPFDVIAVAGDTWDGPIQNTAGARFREFVGLIQHLADLAPVVMIYGTPSHDTDGSLEVFELVEAQHKITILRPGVAYGWYGRSDGSWVAPLDADKGYNPPNAVIFGIPEPNKKWLLANAGAVGKADADQAMQSVLRGFLLGLAALRRNFADIPCLVLYHGQISGAKTATGYQADSGLALSKDDLTSIGAEYYALGDIHEPQQIGDFPAYYPGSIYPATWGETHKAGANVVEIVKAGVLGGPELFNLDAGFNVTVSRLPFPHPARVKLATRIDSRPEYSQYADTLVWHEIICTREQAAAINPEDILSDLLDAGALPGSRVTLNIESTETVRAGQIIEKTALRDKVEVWAENASLPPTPSALLKAEELEREYLAKRPAGSGAHWRIKKLILRGATGIWKKSRKDEIILDLAKYNQGLIAFVSHNGAGKSTILENLHPWPCMLTRDGTLKDHFRLADSCRDLYLLDERTGWHYRAQITIRADIASGSAEYYLYCDKGAGFEPLPGINGRKEPYESAVAELFGSIEMYLQTAFVTQRANRFAPDLSSATKGQKKALFAELSGIDYLAKYAETAKAKASEIEEETRKIQAFCEAASGIDKEIEDIINRMSTARTDERSHHERALKTADTVALLQAEREEVANKVSLVAGKHIRKETVEKEIKGLESTLEILTKEVKGFQEAADGKDRAQRELTEYEELASRLAALTEEKASIAREHLDAQNKYVKEVALYDSIRQKAQEAVDQERFACQKIDRELAVARSKIDAPLNDHCPTCLQLLPEDRREHLKAEREAQEKRLATLETEATEAHGALSRAETLLTTLARPVAPVIPPYAREEELKSLESELEWIDIERIRKALRMADEAAVYIQSTQTRIGEARAGIASRREELSYLIAEIEASKPLTEKLTDLTLALSAARTEHQNATNEESAARARIEAEARALSAAEERKCRRDEERAKLDTLAPELADWRYLERALGADGIQALELDALAPGIADIANRLLASSGNTGRLEFRTTRIGGKGAKAKQIEDFLIYYIDQAGEEQEISTLSGGETVWVRKALYDAFSVIRARNHGVKFNTVFLDEADGALDPENRLRYVRMIEAAHAESGRYQTVLVTQSREVEAMVETVITVADLPARTPARMAEVA